MPESIKDYPVRHVKRLTLTPRRAAALSLVLSYILEDSHEERHYLEVCEAQGIDPSKANLQCHIFGAARDLAGLGPMTNKDLRATPWQ